MKKKKEFLYFLIIFLVGCILLPNTSPFSVRVPQTMVNDYMNFAKSMLHGQVLYTDLYDHKGVFLFYLYLLPVAISKTSYWGVYAAECIVSVILEFLIYRTFSRKNSPGISVLLTVLTTIILYFAYPMALLNSEPVAIILVLYIYNLILDKKHLSNTKLFYLFCGLAFAILFWMKYVLILMLFPIWLYLLFINIREISLLEFVKNCLYSLASFIVFSLLMCIYFVKNNNFGDMLEVYFGNVKHSINLEVSIPSIISVLIIFTIIILFIQNEKTKEMFYILIACLLVFGFLNLPGGFRTYSACIVIIPFVMLMPDVTKCRSGLFGMISILLLSGMLFLMIDFKYEDYTNRRAFIEDTANQYGITNQNILYICEDTGFGIYSDYPYRAKLQWFPGRLVVTNEIQKYYENLLNNNSYEYASISIVDYDTMTENCFYYPLKENFEIITTYNKDFYLLKRR